MTQIYKILFITDIHLNFPLVQKLKKWHQNNQITFDACLVGGDTANCDQNTNTHNQQSQLNLSDKILKQIQQIFNCKMYFIPGNHDPLIYNKPGHKITENIISCHETKIQIVQGVQLIGFGGSVPGYLDIQRKKQTWKGYPYNSNEQLQKYCVQNKIFDNLNTEKQKIYLTHCGPFDYQTSIDRRDLNNIVYGGAAYFNKLMTHKNVLLYLHGHVHNGSRFAKGNQIPLVNPGGFIYGEFGYIFLQRNKEQGKWSHQSTHFINLLKK